MVDTALAGIDVFGLELELRRLVGVAAARVEVLPAPAGMVVSVAVLNNPGGMRESVTTVSEAYFSGPIRVEVVELSPPTVSEREVHPRAPRVRLLAVHASDDGTEVEVHLGHGARRSVGRSPERPMIGAAKAAMAALRSLGAHLPYEIEVITRLGPENTAPVLVVLRSADNGHNRMGVVRGGDDHVATVRALLHALNRHLELALNQPAPLAQLTLS